MTMHEDTFRTPLKKARRLGSGKTGTSHFWWQRVTAIALVIAMFWHAKLGVQVVIEDYVHTRWLEIALQLLNLVACFAGALACLFALGHVAMVVAAGTP